MVNSLVMKVGFFISPLRLNKYKITMTSPFSPKNRQPTLTTKQCKQIIQNTRIQKPSEDATDKQQQYWFEHCQEFIESDHKKQEQIKDRLIKQFFGMGKRKRSKEELRKQFAMRRTGNSSLRKEAESKIRDSLSLVFKSRSQTPKTPVFSRRYDGANAMSLTISDSRPLTSPASPFTARPERQTNSRQFYSSQIDSIIEQSNKIKKYRSSSTPKVKYPRSKQKQMRIRDQRQKYRIVDKMIASDIDDYVKGYSIDLKAVNPEKQKQQYEDRKRAELTNFDKYNMTFVNFMRQKTSSNVEKAIYNQKIRHKNSYIEKFQKHLLDQYKLSSQNRNRLQRVFKNIEHEFRGHTKNRKLKVKLNG